MLSTALRCTRAHIAATTKIGKRVQIVQPTNIYGSKLMDDCFVGPFCEIQKNTVIGKRTRVSSHSFICEHVTIGDDVFIGHGVMFTNDKYNRDIGDHIHQKTIIEDRVRIGTNATILPVRIGCGAIVGAGAVVTKDVLPNEVVAGVPARPMSSSSEGPVNK